MGSSRNTVIVVAAGPSGWEVRHGGQVLYWGPSLDRTVREARRAADLFDGALVVIEGMGDREAPRQKRRGLGLG
jgi:hypothetical protein